MNYKTPLMIVDDSRHVLARRQGDRWSLPDVEVEIEFGRVGVSLSRAVRKQLGLEIFCLVVPEAKNLHVLRLQSLHSTPASGLVWVDSSQLAEQDLLHSIDTSTNEIGGYLWYSQVTAWLEEQIPRLGYGIRGLEQWNGRIGGVLIRVVTNGPDFWFKAVSDFNIREMNIAQLLAARHPAHFPRVLATEPAWNAFLLEHVAGIELSDCADLATWKNVAVLLAQVQMDWLGLEDALLRARAADLRAETLANKIPGFLDYIEDSMARQPKTPPRRLARTDLVELGYAIHDLCAAVSSLPFAQGLANADFSPHNTLLTNQGPVFIDWAEACVSLPLIAGEYLWNRMAVESPARVRWQSALRTAYLCPWAENFGGAQVEQAAKLLPAFAIFAVEVFYLEGRGKDGGYDSYLRSLTRRLAMEVRRNTDQSYAIPV